MIEVKPGQFKVQSIIEGNISHVHMLLNDVVNELKNTIHGIVVHNKTKTCQIKVAVQNGTMFIEVTNHEEDEKFRFEPVTDRHESQTPEPPETNRVP